MPQPVATDDLVASLAHRGSSLAIVSREGSLTYAQLADRVAAARDRLGPVRRLVQVAGANALEPLVAYLGALAGGHPVLLTPGDDARAARLAAAYDPDVVVSADGGGWRYDERREGTAHALHPDLALLLSTSGSTGSPKLVRLSMDNLRSNAASIAEFLGIRETDRAATTLPMHYCYGLSVINSHLLHGAALVLTDMSVVDECFWQLVRDAGVTTFAGVPHTFDLLDRVGFDTMDLPQLRYVTQAGGRLAPSAVSRYAELGRSRGWDFVVMYGQTEATARMAYLPADLALTRPSAIGVPIPGGSLRIEPYDGATPGTGELVYSGPNVMMGYASTPADLDLGATVDELRTGDIARRADDGLFEVVGRRGRTVKVFGLRVDPEHVEAVLAETGTRSCCLEVDGNLFVAVEGSASGTDTRQLVASLCRLPLHAVRVIVVDALPRLASGKPDLDTVRGLAVAPVAAIPAGSSPAALRAIYAEALGFADVPESSSFVSLGGDSLSYVELSVRLEEALGDLPTDWHTRSIGDLASDQATVIPPPSGRRWRVLDTSVALRALAILLVVGSHANVLAVLGGAHLLVTVAGFNVARFHLTSVSRHERLRHLGRTIARVAVPSIIWITAVHLLTSQYTWANVALLNFAVGSDALGSPWQFWFLEAFVVLLAGVALLVSVPAFDRFERRWPFGFVAVVLMLGLSTRFGLVDLPAGPQATQSPQSLVWLFALGWAAAKATSSWQRWAVAAAAVATVPGFFGEPAREALVVAGVLLLLGVSTVRVPVVLHGAFGVLASSSLYIYLTHWQVFPLLQDRWPLLALLASLLVGIGYWRLSSVVTSRVVARRTAAVDG